MSLTSPGNRPTLFILGDSISIQYGPYLERLLVGHYICDRKGSELLAAQEPGSRRKEILERLAAMDDSQAAINGGHSYAVLAYLQARSNPVSPAWTVLLLNCGLHDIRTDPRVGARQVEPDIYAENLTKIFHLAAKLSQWVVWMRTTPVVDALHQRLNPEFQRFNADVERYNQIADALVEQAGIPSIDLYRFTQHLSSSAESLEALYRDHVHFVEPVQQQQAAYIAGWLEAYPFD